MIVSVKLTELEATLLARVVENAGSDLDEPSMFPGDWRRGERAAARRMVEKLRAALPSKESHANPS